MKTAAICALLLSTTAGLAETKCFVNEDDPAATVAITDMKMTWRPGDGRTIELEETSAGTGIPRRIYADGEGNAYGFTWVDGALVLDYGVYRPAACP